jgi:hypothetical protein
MRRPLILLGLLVAAVACVVAVDRVSLALWRFRVNRFADRVRAAVSAFDQTDPNRFNSIVAFSADPGPWRVPGMQLRMVGPSPAYVTVDGNGGLNLTFLPPALAWSRNSLLHRGPRLSGAQFFPLNDVYVLRITSILGRSPGVVLPKPEVSLHHGLPF